ncbi:hypothetical protein B0T16DRAFT_195468 [Cercophora newfieldiana]|uniref:CYTH domain-containing protein n=1 Tax=Cercophora newfieldiana TaxID=92897 RepID=A0AA40CNZ0_9PEZI|nr:hypothetical protein B0T16DRAFT_195468 [Cercophora newfieldiana]
MAPNLKEDYEIKLLLNPDVALDPVAHKPTAELLSLFSASPTPTQMNVQFLDDDDKSIYNAGWSPRIRRTEGKPLELTYKKRYPITGEDVHTALSAANSDGFDASDTKYEAQVEWGYSKMTLSVTREKKVDDGEVDALSLPDAEKSRKMLIDEAPGKFKDFGGTEDWGVRALSAARVYGPILAERYVGTWDGNVKVYVEVWPIMIRREGRVEYVTEVSFKAKKRSEGGTVRDGLIEVLREKGWLCPVDSLKTQLIMENY